MVKKHNTVIIGLIALLMVVTITNVSQAVDNEQDQDIEERMKLIRASLKLKEEKSESPSNHYGLYLTDFATESGQANLGIKLEMRFPQKNIEDIKNSQWRYVVEGIYLKDKRKLAGFISLKRSWTVIKFAPYLGFGSEITGRAKYQLFTGLNFNNNFFIELKLINKKGPFKESKIYSVAGYQINF